jgi:hypothetical protein
MDTFVKLISVMAVVLYVVLGLALTIAVPCALVYYLVTH